MTSMDTQEGPHALLEEKGPRSHLDQEDQQKLKSGLWPCLKPDLAP